jgi:hypothetical protein
MAKEETLDDKLIDKYHTLVKDLQKIPESPSSKTLLDLLNEEVQKFYLENRDKEKGLLKFESDEQKRDLAFSLWDKAADHVAKKYLKMSDEQIKEMKDLGRDPDGNDIWETFIGSHLGAFKEDFFDSLESIDEINPQTIYKNLIEPLYKSHITVRTTRRAKKDIRNVEDAQNVTKYLQMVKYHLPDTFKSYKPPSKLKSPEQVTSHFIEVAQTIPGLYHPANKATHERKYSK